MHDRKAARRHEKIGLRINVGKTKIMSIGKANHTNICISNGPVKEVNHFQYLSSLMMHDCGTEKDLAA